MIEFAIYPRSKLGSHFDAFYVEDKGFLGYMFFHIWLSKVPLLNVQNAHGQKNTVVGYLPFIGINACNIFGVD